MDDRRFHRLVARAPRRVAALAALLAMVMAAPAAAAPPLDAQEIIRTVETKYQGDTSRGEARMTIVTGDWTRELKLAFYSEGRDRMLIRILEPKKEAGIATLKRDDEIWNYLPKIDRLMKVPSAMMGEGWMGSHLTNDDLVKESKIDQEYTFTVAAQTPATATIVGTPKPDAVVVWGRIAYDVDLQKLVPLSVRYFDEDGVLVRTITFDQVQQVSGRWVPMRMRVQPIDEPDESTTIHYESLALNVTLDEDLSTLRSLRRR